jgi:uncharacterized protein
VDRDRDANGRARNARPRDGLGRPLPYDSTGVPRPVEVVARTPDQTVLEAQRLLDAGQPFHAHEVFEDAWKSVPAVEAGLWKGLAQLAVAVTHQRRGNLIGAQRLRHRGAASLDSYASAAGSATTTPYGIDIARLVDWARGSSDAAMPSLRR